MSVANKRAFERLSTDQQLAEIWDGLNNLSGNVDTQANTFTALGNVFTHGLKIDTIASTAPFLVDGTGDVSIINTGALLFSDFSSWNVLGAGDISIQNTGRLDIVGPSIFAIDPSVPFHVSGHALSLTSNAVVGGTNTGDQTSVSGNAGTATKLAAAVNINGVAFDGSANIIVTNIDMYGGGTDGVLATGAGVTTLTRDTYYSSWTPGAGDKIATNNHTLFIAVCDMTNVQAASIIVTAAGGNDGGDAAGATAGAIPTYSPTTASINLSARGSAGKAGVTTAGTAGSAGTSQTNGCGGNGGQGGVGGTGIGGTVNGGAVGAGGTITNAFLARRPMAPIVRGATLFGGGAAGGVGGAGGGSGAGSSGGSGGSGSAGSLANIFIGVLTTAVTTPAGVISFVGGKGGAGGNSPTATSGAGAGGGGGGGGSVNLTIGARIGPAVANFMDASGGNGGVGGTGNTTGNGGQGGNGGNGGSITLSLMYNASVTVLDNTATAGTAGGTTANTVAGTAGVGTSTKMNLPA